MKGSLRPERRGVAKYEAMDSSVAEGAAEHLRIGYLLTSALHSAKVSLMKEAPSRSRLTFFGRKFDLPSVTVRVEGGHLYDVRF